MIDKLKELIAEAEAFSAQSKDEVEAFRIKFLGSKGLLKQYFAEYKNVANEQKKEFGQTINQLKKTAEDKVNALNDALEFEKNYILYKKEISDLKMRSEMSRLTNLEIRK